MIPRLKTDGYVDGVRRCNFGGGGSSSSSTTQQTTNNMFDNRQTNDNRTTNTSTSTTNSDSRQFVDSRNLSDNSTTTNNITSIDAGAVDLAKSIGNNAITSNATNTDKLLSAATMLFSQQQNALDANVNLAKSLAGTAQSAYSDAASTAAGNKPILYGALAVMAMIAASFFGKKSS